MIRFSFDLLSRAAPALAALLLLSACDEDPHRPDPDPDPVPQLSDVAAVTVIDTAGSIFRSIEVTLDSAARVEVFYAPAAGAPVLRMRADSAAAFHRILLPRLRAATDYQLAVRSYDQEPAAVSDSVYRASFETDSLPEVLGLFSYSTTGTSSFPMLMVPFRSPALGWSGQVAIESDGTIVWYFESSGGTLVAHPVPGTHDMIFIENGFPSDGGRNGIVRVTPERQVVGLVERGDAAFGQIHHDATAVDAERVLFLAYDTMTVRDTLVNGESVWEWNMSTGAVEKKWSSWGPFDWDVDRGPGSTSSGWFHANSIMVGPRGNVVISSRSLNQIFSIAPDFESIEYRVGGVNSTIALAPADTFIGQHSAWELPNGNLLLFDNNGAGPGAPEPPASRALELQFDGDSAFMVWQYDPVDPNISSPLRGGVYRLPSGNTLSIFASLPFAVHETTPAGAIVWTFTGDNNFTSTFRVAPWPSIAGEVEVDAMP